MKRCSLNWVTGMVERRGSVLLQPGVVLHRRPFRDTSLLLELFTPQYGRVGLVARGARGKRSGWAALLQPFQAVTVGWRGNGELRTLTDAEASSAPRVLAGDALPAGFYLCELLLRTCQRDDPHPRLYMALEAAFVSLERAMDQAVLRRFEKVLLEEIGYGLQLDRQADDGSPVLAERRYRYVPEQGAWPLESPAAGGVEVSGAALLALAREEPLEPGWHGELRKLMRGALAPVLGSRPLRSRDLYQSLQRLRTGGI